MEPELQLAFGEGCEALFALKARKSLKAVLCQVGPSITSCVRLLMVPLLHHKDGWWGSRFSGPQTGFGFMYYLENEHKHYQSMKTEGFFAEGPKGFKTASISPNTSV